MGPDCVGRHDTSTALRELRVDRGLASSLGTWGPQPPSPFRGRVCSSLESVRPREAIAGDYGNRCGPRALCADIFAAYPWMAGVRRAAPAEIRSASLRAKRHLPPTNASGMEDVRVRGEEVPSEGTSSLLMAARTRGAGSRAEQVAMLSIGRIRLNRAPKTKFEQLLGPDVPRRYRALEYFRRAANETDDVPARALANERKYLREAARLLFAAYFPNVGSQRRFSSSLKPRPPREAPSGLCPVSQRMRAA